MPARSVASRRRLHAQRLRLGNRPGQGIRAGAGRTAERGFTPIPNAYNCSGQAVEVRKVNTAQSTFFVEVRFVDNPATALIATPVHEAKSVPEGNGAAPRVSVGLIAPGEWVVRVRPQEGGIHPTAAEVLVP
jgi:hypothetical protein